MTLLQTKKKCICAKKLERIEGIIISTHSGFLFLLLNPNSVFTKCGNWV